MENEEDLKRKVTEGIGMCAVLIIVLVLISIDITIAAIYLLFIVGAWIYLTIKRRGDLGVGKGVNNGKEEKNS